MSNAISRRDFLKASSAVGLAAAINPASAVTTAAKKSRVVIATDSSSVSSSGTPDAAKLQDLVDHAIMTLSGKTDKGAAYEALFPAAVSSSTNIVLKRNDVSGAGTVNTAVTNALANGLKSMLGGKFAGAIKIVCQMRGVSKFISDSTYVINCPVAWAHGIAGVTLSLKNQMNYKQDPSTSMHTYDSTDCWIYKYPKEFKSKQVLSFMDAIVGNAQSGPGGKPNFSTGTIIAGSDLVAVDYNTLRLMAKQSKVSTSGIAQGDAQLKEAEKQGVGTCTPANMEVITVTPPWGTVGTINGAEKIMQSLNFRVINQGNKVDFVLPGAFSKHVAIFDMSGNAVWQSRNVQAGAISWDHRTLSGGPVPSGMYVFRIAGGNSIMRGTVTVTH
jgi:hypothetical protein